MKRMLLTLVIMISWNLTTAQNADEIYLRNLKENLWPKAYQTQDTVLLDQILHDQFQMIDADGLWSTKQDELKYIKANKPIYDSFRFEIKRLEIFDGQTAVISGVGHVKGKGKGGPYYFTYHSSNVLIKTDEKWCAINSHLSGVKDQPMD